MIVAVGCGALLVTITASATTPPREESLLARLLGADLGTVITALPTMLCGNRLISYNSPTPNSPTTCVNGPENSGNSTNSGNYQNEGDPINSGNFSNSNGSDGSNNVLDGGNTANGPQSLAG
ncbi:hypothetical protein [Nonomuraea basaltis]|uniref:hypothetical protein n=1 Tax=Nonomuraea basaltis TaxID=2495887 RepID=UPI0019810572|nr:hypothetical protein [Nonomuraea basaltis]